MIRLKTLFAILIGSLFVGISLNAKSLLDRYNSGNVPKLRQMKKTDLVSMYQSSSHARALEAQKLHFYIGRHAAIVLFALKLGL